MSGIDDAIGGLGNGGGLLVALAVALLLGLRHATDPDHLTAVSTLAMADEERGPRRAATLGAAWGIGHASTLLILGLPVVLLGGALPDVLQHAFEVAIGVVIVLLALRLLARWRRGYFHVHVHTHDDGERHAHPHVHEGPHTARHEHGHSLGRSPLASFGIGLLHGAGGSAGVGVLLIAAMPDRAVRTAALVVLALGTVASMATISAGFGYALARGPLLRRFERAAPLFGGLSLVFGVWYALGALGAAPAP